MVDTAAGLSSDADVHDFYPADPATFGLSPDLAGVFQDAGSDGHPDASDEAEDDPEGPRKLVKGEPYTAHIAAYRHVQARKARAHALQRGVDDILAHLDGSPGCTRLGHSEDACHVRHLWAPDELLATLPDTPSAERPLPGWMGYPHCTLPWWGWGWGVVKPGHSALLHIFRIWRANRLVTAQIAASGGVDDDRGWLIDLSCYSFPQASFAEWRRSLYLTDEERAAEAKAKRKAGDSARKRVVRKAERDVAPPVGKSGKRTKRPIEVCGDHALVPLTQGYVARIPAADVPLVEGFNWSTRVFRGRDPVAFRQVQGVDGKPRNLMMHKVEGMTGPVEIIAPASAALAA